MIRQSPTATIAIIVFLMLGVSACGQMGPLTLPDEVVDDPDEDGGDANER